MTIFNQDISDTRKLAGLTKAREAYNATLPEVFDKVTGKPAVPKPGTLSDAEYLVLRVNDLLDNYARQYVDDPMREPFLSTLSPTKRREVETILAR